MYRQPALPESHPLRKLPVPVKRGLSRAYWVGRDITDWLAELVGGLPSHSCRVFLYRYVFRVGIGSRTSVHRGCRMYHPSRIVIGSNTVINRDVLLDGRMGLVIGDNVSIAEQTLLITLGHGPNFPDFATLGGPITIEDYVFIGIRAMVLPDIRIGKGAVVGAGAVVTRDVEPYVVVAGVPARPIGERSRELTYELNYRKILG